MSTGRFGGDIEFAVKIVPTPEVLFAFSVRDVCLLVDFSFRTSRAHFEKRTEWDDVARP